MKNNLDNIVYNVIDFMISFIGCKTPEKQTEIEENLSCYVSDYVENNYKTLSENDKRQIIRAAVAGYNSL